MSKASLKMIHIDQAEIGVYVAKLDIPWLDSPFWGSSRLIKNDQDIERLRSSGAKKIVIDISKGKDVPVNRPESPVTKAEQGIDQAEALSESVARSGDRTTFDKEISAAQNIRKRVAEAVKNFHVAIAKNESFDVSELHPVIEETLSSLERNDQALMNLVHMSRKSKELSDHAFGAFCLALNIAVAMGMNESDREALALAALFHEAGWTSLPLNLLGKRKPYTTAETTLIHKHPVIAGKILANFDIPELSRRVIAEHHELMDGSGYPAGLSGDQIHPLSRLLAVVDGYEERVHQLLDKPGMLPTNALKSLYQEAESGRYDPKIVALLISMLGIYPPTTPIQLNTGEKGVVREVHPEAPLLPVVAIYYDKSGLARAEPDVIDLSSQRGVDQPRSISNVLDPSLAGVDPAKRLLVTEDSL